MKKTSARSHSKKAIAATFKSATSTKSRSAMSVKKASPRATGSKSH